MVRVVFIVRSLNDKEALDKLVVKVAESIPVPVTLMLLAKLVAFEVILIVPLYDLTSVGEKVTVIVSLLAGEIVAVVALKEKPAGAVILVTSIV